MRKIILAYLMLLLSHTLFAEGFLGTGAALSSSSSADPVYTPGMYLTGGYDLFHPLASEWSLFSNGGGRVSYYPGSGDLEASGYVTADGSYRGDPLFARIEAGTYAEYTSWQAAPYIRSYGEVYVSLDYPDVSVFTDPSFVWDIEEGFHSLGTEGSAGLSFSLGSFILSPAFLFGSKISPAEGNESTLGALLNLSWYPGVPLTMAGTAGVTRIDSPVTETLLEAQGPVSVDSGTIFYWKSEAEVFLGSRFDIDVAFDGSVTLKDYNYIEDAGAVGDGNEYRLFMEPGINFSYTHSPALDVQFALGLQVLRSNSTYLNSISGSADIGVYWYF